MALGKADNDAYFNPRSHEGSDGNLNVSGIAYKISIHAPTRGATAKIIATGIVRPNFNPRSHEGSDAAWTTID